MSRGCFPYFATNVDPKRRYPAAFQVAVLLSKFLSASEHVLRSMIQCNIIDIVDQSLGGMGSGTPIGSVGTTEHEANSKDTLLRPAVFQV